jgi:uncharacterized protein (TIGR02300 family)
MAEADWGVKRLCPTTGKRFYDMNRSPIISPYTGEEVVIETPGKNRATAVAERKSKKTEAMESADDADLLDEDDVLDDEDADDVNIDDDSVLDDEEDDNVSLDEIADVAKDEND